jgi:hypothetical protein
MEEIMEEKEVTVEDVKEGQTEIYYAQNVTVNDNHGTIIFKQTGSATPPPVPPKP